MMKPMRLPAVPASFAHLQWCFSFDNEDQLALFACRLFDKAAALCSEYRGDFWEARLAPDGAAYAVPTLNDAWPVCVYGNHFEGEMDADAFGLTVTLFTLCDVANLTERDEHIQAYYDLRAYAANHPDAALILAAID